jgi:hypothetical protein
MSTLNHTHGHAPGHASAGGRTGTPRPASPFGWSAGRRLAFALAGSAALWLAVAWALGWL